MTWDKFVLLLFDNADKYILIAGPAFLTFYILLKNKIFHRKIQPRYPRMVDFGREIVFSTLSIIIFSIPPLVILYSDRIRPHTSFYENINEFGIVYFVLAFPLMLLIHDTYFYWYTVSCTTRYYLECFILYIIGQRTQLPGRRMLFTH